MSSTKDVRRISTTKVRPASYLDEQNHNHQRIDLSPNDLYPLRHKYMQKGLLFSKQHEEVTNDESIHNKISHLKTSLSHTLDHFFPLAGRLGIEKHEDDNTISVYINCNFEGAEFIHATAEISIEDIQSPTYVPQSIIDPLFSFNGVKNFEGQSHPLLSIQVTELTDGVFISCSANHSVCDGTSIWHFLNIWSEISRSSHNHTSLPPLVFKRWFIKETDCPIRLPISFADKLSAVRMSTRNTEAPSLEGLVERCFRFTKPSIGKLKARALEIVSETKPSMVISSLQAILAHVWTAVIRARISLTNNHDESRSILFALFMNSRAKLIPPLPEAYFGNSLCWGDVLLKEGELLDKGFGFLASSLNEVVNSHSYEKNLSFIKSWIEKPRLPDPSENTNPMDGMLLARSSQRFNKYGNDFGWGRPIAVRTGANGKSYGITTVSSGSVEGSIDIEICLPVEVLKAMENDVEFMEALQ
ncbi:hypothetical protein MKW94_026840 [Papaver nudicaule]|uniref:HXXXD-type acyl-transferase family protein n=1 Tax=Papaver nudicaule TaxID=74823 RepID=A0AA41VVC7_PAPNU|nr:hypothetical protein [Papaver nudicaule]